MCGRLLCACVASDRESSLVPSWGCSVGRRTRSEYLSAWSAVGSWLAGWSRESGEGCARLGRSGGVGFSDANAGRGSARPPGAVQHWVDWELWVHGGYRLARLSLSHVSDRRNGIHSAISAGAYSVVAAAGWSGAVVAAAVSGGLLHSIGEAAVALVARHGAGDSSRSERSGECGLLIETSSGGSGKHLADLAAGLTGNGHCVHVLYSPLRSSHEFREALAESGASVASASMKRSIGLSVLKELSHVRSWLRAIGPLDVLHAHSTKAMLGARLSLA